MYYTTGWKAVERGVKIPHNLETTPLQIKTDSTAGSRKEVLVDLYTAGGDKAGRRIRLVDIQLSSTVPARLLQVLRCFPLHPT